MSDDYDPNGFRAPEPLAETQLCQVCGHHLGADHIGQHAAASRAVGMSNGCTNCDACDAEERTPSTLAAMGIADAESAWREADHGDPECRNCGPFGACDQHDDPQAEFTRDGEEIERTVSTEVANSFPEPATATTEHDCDAESCHSQAESCGGCCMCLGGCVHDGPRPGIAPAEAEQAVREAAPLPIVGAAQICESSRVEREADASTEYVGVALHGPLRLTKVDDNGQPTGESMLIADAAVSIDLAPRGRQAGKSSAEPPAVPAPLAPCGCTNVSSCGRSRHWHKVQASNQRAYFEMLRQSAGSDEAAERALIKATGFGRDIPANLGPAVQSVGEPDRPAAFGSVTPSVAHEIMQRVTGQAQYMGAAELAARTAQAMRDSLATVRLPGDGTLTPEQYEQLVRHASVLPPEEARRLVRMVREGRNPGLDGLRELMADWKTTLTQERRVQTRAEEWKRVAAEAEKLHGRIPAVDVDAFIAEQMRARATADERALHAMGAKGDDRELLLEIDGDQGLFDRQQPRLRALLRDRSVSVEFSVPDLVRDYPELLTPMGTILAECAGKLNDLVRTAADADERMRAGTEGDGPE